MGSSLVILSINGQTELAKKLSDKIDTRNLSDKQHYEILWGVANNRLPGGEQSSTFLIFQHLLEKGLDPSKKNTFGQTVLGEIAKQFGAHLDTEIALVKSILRKTGVAEAAIPTGNKVFASKIGEICEELANNSAPNSSVRKASGTSSTLPDKGCCVVS